MEIRATLSCARSGPKMPDENAYTCSATGTVRRFDDFASCGGMMAGYEANWEITDVERGTELVKASLNVFTGRTNERLSLCPGAPQPTRVDLFSAPPMLGFVRRIR